ncbi:MAG: hypothetical protein RL758_1485 [Pseudomonadota bacterium]|jgi:membrane-associated PAP2 superfamily phosphatase
MAAAVERNRQKWQADQWRWLLVCAVVLLLVFELTNLDRTFSDLFFTASEGFLGAQIAWFEPVMHEGLKRVMLLLAVGSSGWLIWRHCLNPLFSSRVLWMGVSALILVPLSIVLLKWLTHRPCPWSLSIYGGSEPYESLLSGFFPMANTPMYGGMCFPAGHASGGFLWLGWAAAFWVVNPRWARVFAALGWISGFVMGLTRVMQGAHFLSHVFWAAWVSWVVCVFLTHAFKMRGMDNEKD